MTGSPLRFTDSGAIVGAYVAGGRLVAEKGDGTLIKTGSTLPAATLTNDAVTAETIVARWAVAAGTLAAGGLLALRFAGLVSSTATLGFKLRVGTAGSTADALVQTFTTSAAGAANTHVSGDLMLAILTEGVAGTATADGRIQVGAGSLSALAAAYAAATVNTTVANFVSLTLVQSLAQSYTSRMAALSPIV